MAENLEAELQLLWKRVYARAAAIAREEVIRQFGGNLRGGKLSPNAIQSSGTPGQVLTTTSGGTAWQAPSSGTVTSIGVSVPAALLTATGSPVTGSGTIAITLVSQSANRVLAGPTTGSAAAPTFRALVAADLPLATTGAFGAVKPDGTTITVSGGVLSASFVNPMTTAADLIVAGASGTPTRLAIGGIGQLLLPVGTDELAYGTPPTSGGWLDPTTTDGQLLYRHYATAGSVPIGFIGDSITYGFGATTAPPAHVATNLTTASLTASASNQSNTSSPKSADWTPGAGAGYLTAAKAAFVSAGVRIVHYMIGANDAIAAVSAATWRANVLATVQDLVQHGYVVVLSGCLYATNSGGALLPYLAAYNAALPSLIDGVNVRLGDTGAYALFGSHTAYLQSDGLHPNDTGTTALGLLWANALAQVVTALSLTTLAPLSLGTNLSITGGVLNAAALADPMTTEGDLIYRHGGVATRLPLGTSGQVVTSNGTDPIWAAAAVGTGEVLMQNGVTFPPVPLTTEDGADWLYSG